MRAGERRKYQIADIRMSRVNRQRGTLLRHAGNRRDVGKIQSRRDALRIQIQRQRHHIDVATALAIAKQATFNPLRAGQHRQFRAGHTGSPIIVRMYGQHEVLAPFQPPVHPFNLVGEDVGRSDFDRARQVDNHRPLRPGIPGANGGVADGQ